MQRLQSRLVREACGNYPQREPFRNPPFRVHVEGSATHGAPSHLALEDLLCKKIHELGATKKISAAAHFSGYAP